MQQRAFGFRAVIALLVLLLATGRAGAVTLGDLVVQSPPGEPLQAIIPLTLQPEESLTELKVVLAPAETYALQNLQRPDVLNGMRIALLAKGENRARIQLFGEQPWQGEGAILLLQLNWPQGEMVRRFRLVPLERGEAVAGNTPLYVEVAENESLDTIAIRLSQHSNRSYMHMMVALYRANPDAFYRDNINNLKRGARLRVPSAEELYQLSDAEVFATLREHEARRKERQEQTAREQQEAQQLEQQLQQVKQESSEIEQRNRELRERLARLEQQMSSMSRQVLQRPPAAEGAATESPLVTPEQAEADDAKRPRVEEGLSAPLMLLLMLAVVAMVVGIWRFAPRLGRGD